MISPDTGFIRRPTIRRFTHAKMYATGKHGKYYIFVGIKYVDELLYNRGRHVKRDIIKSINELLYKVCKMY